MNEQIEEMANDIAKICPDLVENSCGQINCVTHLTLSLYKEGYRKQSEGEWIVCGTFDDFVKCSSCGDKHPWQTATEYKYCPNCGAHMKGGDS